MHIMILYKIFNKNLFLTEWKDAPCPPGAAPLQCALFLGMCSQVGFGLSAPAGSFYL